MVTGESESIRRQMTVSYLYIERQRIQEQAYLIMSIFWVLVMLVRVVCFGVVKDLKKSAKPCQD
jgi:uncharacterized membrane protein